MVDWEADSWSLRHVNKNDNKEKKSLKSIIKRYPFIYYAIVGVIILLVLKFIQPAIMMRIARQTVYDMKGTNYLLVQTDDTILRYILPFGFALSMSISVTIAFLLILLFGVEYGENIEGSGNSQLLLDRILCETLRLFDPAIRHSEISLQEEVSRWRRYQGRVFQIPLSLTNIIKIM